MKDFEHYWNLIKDHIITYSPRLIAGIFILWIGMKLIKYVTKFIEKLLERIPISNSLKPFIISLVGSLSKILVVLIAVNVLGADLSGLVAIMAAASFAVGMSLQGSLGNLASGILILFIKPYELGDWISIGDRFGKVTGIGIFNTEVQTPGNKMLIIPNSKITDDLVVNYSKIGVLRLEIFVGMPYEEDFERVSSIIEQALSTVDHILADPKPTIGIEDFDSHSVTVGVKPYIKPDYYWDVMYASRLAIMKAFTKEGVKVAYSEGVELGKIGG